MLARSGAGITLTNPLNAFSVINASNPVPGATGNIDIQNNRAVQLIQAVNAAPGGTISIINNTGDMLVSGSPLVSTAGGGAANITLQTAGLLTISTQPVTAGGTGVVNLTGTGITNSNTITGPGGVNINAGTGAFTNSSGATIQGIVTNSGTGAPIAIIADSVNLQTGGALGNSQIIAGSGTVSLQPLTALAQYQYRDWQYSGCRSV